MSKTLVVLGLIVGLISSCSERACTEIGCVNGLVLNFDLEEGTLAEVTLANNSNEEMLECGGIQSDCGATMIFDSFFPSSMHVILTKDSMVVSDYTQAIEFSDSQPNGPGCEPTCTQASVTISD